MNAVGIDVSKGKSMVAALRPMGEVAITPCEIRHDKIGLEHLADLVVALSEDTRVIMEATGRYHEPVVAALHEAGIFVSVLNPILISLFALLHINN
ncbi:MAG: IS110 family transposase [Dehalobacter sp. 4CP]|uniref:IS110 family transposase n=1 Tax=Dehalobacter sp. CP TaxID=2594474 RepID=UPI0013C7C955|nr:IS110 family transposase [Dehalobacter sp. 4CP]